MNKMTLITGGGRSGKSRHALELAKHIKGNKIFLATAKALDPALKKRIEKCKKQRNGNGWLTFEEPFQPATILTGLKFQPGVLILDSLTFWVANLLRKDYSIEQIPDDELFHYLHPYILDEASILMAESRKLNCQIIFITDEVGSGIVPDDKLARAFRDVMGEVNQLAAQQCDEIIHMISGIPTAIKL